MPFRALFFFSFRPLDRRAAFTSLSFALCVLFELWTGKEFGTAVPSFLSFGLATWKQPQPLSLLFFSLDDLTLGRGRTQIFQVSSKVWSPPFFSLLFYAVAASGVSPPLRMSSYFFFSRASFGRIFAAGDGSFLSFRQGGGARFCVLSGAALVIGMEAFLSFLFSPLFSGRRGRCREREGISLL